MVFVLSSWRRRAKSKECGRGNRVSGLPRRSSLRPSQHSKLSEPDRPELIGQLTLPRQSEWLRNTAVDFADGCLEVWNW